MAPSAAPPKAQATPPNATTAINARNGGPANANHCPQHPLPERSDGDLKIQKQTNKHYFLIIRMLNAYIGFK